MRLHIAHNLTKFIISSKFIHQVLSLNFCLSCKLPPSCAKLRNALETSRSSDCTKSNVVFGKFYSISKRVCPLVFKKDSILVLLNKDFLKSQLFVEYFYKNIHNFGIKMFYRNSRHTFVLYYLICAWLKFHVSIMRFTRLRQVEISPKLEVFLQKLSN